MLDIESCVDVSKFVCIKGVIPSGAIDAFRSKRVLCKPAIHSLSKEALYSVLNTNLFNGFLLAIDETALAELKELELNPTCSTSCL